MPVRKPSGGGRRRIDEIDRADVTGTDADIDRCGADESKKSRTPGQGDGTGAMEHPAHLAFDQDAARGNGFEKFDACPAPHPDVVAFHGAGDFPAAVDVEISGAIDLSGDFPEHGEVVALDARALDRPFLVDDDVAARLDVPRPRLADFVMAQRNVAAASRALGRFGLGTGGEFAFAFEAHDIPRWVGP